MQNLTHIAVFLGVVDCGSFTAAARRLEMSKPTVSKHITTLEQHLGVRLLNRTTRSLGLTDVGSSFYAHCKNIMTELEVAECEVSQLSLTPRGRLRIAAPTCVGERLLAPELSCFLDLYPEIEIDLVLEDRQVDLIREDFDLAIRILRGQPVGIHAERLAPYVCLVCGAPGYIEQHGAPELPADLVRHNCLAHTQLEKGDLWRLAGSLGVETVKVAGRMRANNGDALRSTLLSGQGLGLMPNFLVRSDLEAGRLCEVLPGYREESHGIYAVYPQDGRTLPKVRAFVDHLAERLEKEIGGAVVGPETEGHAALAV